MKTGYFEELKDGVITKSSIRLQMFITMFYAFLVIGYQVYETGKADIVLATLLLSSAFVPKVISKFAENMAKK